MKSEKLSFYFALLAFYCVFLSCSTEDTYNVSPSGVKADFNVSISDLTVTVTSTASNFTRTRWTFGDGSNSTDANASHTYDKAGDYVIQLAAYGSEGAVSLKEAKISVVDPRPVADFSVSLKELSATFTNKSKLATSYSWDFGNGSTSTAANPTTTYPELSGSIPKVYTITLTVTNSKGSSSTSQDITIFPVPTADFTFKLDTAKATLGRRVIFTSAATGATAYNWDFGDNSNAADAVSIHTYAIKFTYQVTLQAINARDTTSITKTVKLN